MFIALLVFLVAHISGHSEVNVIFKSPSELQNALKPLRVEELFQRIAKSDKIRLKFCYDERLTSSNVTSMRHRSLGNLLQHELLRRELLTVYYPETPRVPHHLTIAFNRREFKGITELSEEENRELFATIKKMAEIYQTLAIHGFVIAQYESPQTGHRDRCVVEIIPHLPGFHEIKNLVDKMESYRYVLFRSANLTAAEYLITDEEIESHRSFWQKAFQENSSPIPTSATQISFPYLRKESHQIEADALLFRQVFDFLEDKGGKIIDAPPCNPVMPTALPERPTTVKVERCFFCDSAILERQLVFEYDDVQLLYNIRKDARVGSSFLILPRRHTEKVYGLTASEIDQIYEVRKALVELLKESHPGCEVIVYTQDNPAVGQTVFHAHEQVVVVDPQTFPLTWNLMQLYPSGTVSNEEMADVCKTFGQKLSDKFAQHSQEKAI